MCISKRVLGAFALGLMGLVALLSVSRAGDLEPPGPPDSTMVTLQEIYDKLDGCCTGGGPYGLSKTGQDVCYDGSPINCAGTGQDGEHQAGVSVNPRFTDNGNGTVKDNLTGLIWLKIADCFGQRSWTGALSVANNLADGSCGLTDGSAVGDWRLPNIRELHSLTDFGEYDPALPPGHPFTGVHPTRYWSSTTRVDATSTAWTVTGFQGYVTADGKQNVFYVWPVRGGL